MAEFSFSAQTGGGNMKRPALEGPNESNPQNACFVVYHYTDPSSMEWQWILGL